MTMDDARERLAPGTLRLFIAVELPDAVRTELDRVIARLRRESPQGAAKWVRSEGVHLTLKFLGPVPSARVEAIQSALQEAARGVPPFQLQPTGLGAFHGSRGGPLEFQRGRESYAHNLTVIWLGLGGDVPELARLARQVEAQVAPLGYPTEKRPFFPHLTLARVPRTAGRAEREALFHAVEPYLSASSRTGRFREGALPDFPAFGVRGRSPGPVDPRAHRRGVPLHRRGAASLMQPADAPACTAGSLGAG